METILDETFFKYLELLIFPDLIYKNIHHPDITTFKKVKREKHKAIFFDKKFKYQIEELHLIKPKINIENKIHNEKTKYYICIIQKLFKIDENESIQKLKKFNGDVYKTILFG